MLWLIWILLMLVVPCVAGIKVWIDINRAAKDVLSVPTKATDLESAPTA